MAVRNVLDGAASFGAALFTSAVCGFPIWFTYVGIRAEVVPVWGYVPAGALLGIGLILTFAFARKGTRGIAPTRQRRRS